MKFVHISDLHMSRSLKYSKDQIKHFSEMLESLFDSEKVVFLITGDIIEKGNKEDYKLGLKFFERFINDSVVFVPVPGNHDIICDACNNFEYFNKFTGTLRNNYDIYFTNSKSYVEINIGEFQLILFNSAYHCNREYGLIDKKALNELNNNDILNNEKIKIALFHHILIPTDNEYLSIIRNSYEFLSFLCEHNFLFGFHGHSHISSGITVGKKCLKLVGVSSLFSPYENNINSQVNIITIDHVKSYDVKKYIYIQDDITVGRWGNFKPVSFNII